MTRRISGRPRKGISALSRPMRSVLPPARIATLWRLGKKLGGPTRDLCENIPEIAISGESCIIISSKEDNNNGILPAYRTMVWQEDLVFELG
jgi:hypothetical protein